ncbi:MAG: hypothetical protein WD825_13660 [Gemmatimonadaceae bacterium]
MPRPSIDRVRVLHGRLVQALVLSGAIVIAGCQDAATPPPPPPPDETITDLVGLGGTWAMARAINAPGRVVGEASVSGTQSRAFSWTALSGIRDLGTLGGSRSAAVAINDHSQIVGWSATASGGFRAFILTIGQTMRDLGVPAGGVDSEASDISDDGTVVGSWLTTGGEPRAFVWTQAAGMRDLSAPGFELVQAAGVNGSGEVVGSAINSSTRVLRALIWSPSGEARELVEGTLPDDWESVASAINSFGHVAGVSWTGNSPQRAFRWIGESGMRDLGVLPGMDWSVARDISGQGHVVGVSGVNGSAVGHAFIWTEADGMRELNGFAASDRAESAAFGVNFYGRVVGYSWNGTVFRPVIFPEPR